MGEVRLLNETTDHPCGLKIKLVPSSPQTQEAVPDKLRLKYIASKTVQLLEEIIYYLHYFRL